MVLSGKHKFYFILIVLLFLLLRAPGLDMPYHQDEAKWFRHAIADDVDIKSGMGHPPLTALTFRAAAKIFGAGHFRMMTLFLSVISFLLIYLFLLKNFSRTAALWGVLIFSVVFYGVLGSLMVDTDGAVLPLFFLISIIGYFNFRKAVGPGDRIGWGLLLASGLAGGILTKLSFILVFGAIGADLVYEHRRLIKPKYIMEFFGLMSIAAGILVLVIFKAKLLGSSYDAERVVGHAKDFFKFYDRNYFQTFFQVAKATMYSSPILFLPVFLISAANFKKVRVLLLYVAFNFIFYVFLFDFSSGAIDKYLLALVMPLSIVSGIVAAEVFSAVDRRFWLWSAAVGFFLAVVISSSQFLPHAVPALYPKGEWISKVLNLKWNFLIPFTGGSGPVGFYISWFFIAVTWLISAALVVSGFVYKKLRPQFLVVLTVLGLGYNIIFAEEYLLGKINGNSSALIRGALEFIDKNPKIGKLMTYNDIGSSYLMDRGRYERRIFVAPKYEKQYISILNSFKGSYLVVEIPKLSSGSIYARYFSTCKIIYQQQSGKISSKIYDCKKAPNLL